MQRTSTETNPVFLRPTTLLEATQALADGGQVLAGNVLLGIQAGHQELTAPSPDNAGLWDPNDNHRVAGYVLAAGRVRRGLVVAQGPQRGPIQESCSRSRYSHLFSQPGCRKPGTVCRPAYRSGRSPAKADESCGKYLQFREA